MCPCAFTLTEKQPTACLLAPAYQRLWLVKFNDASDGSLALGMSSSLTLWPPWRWQSLRLPRGCLFARRQRMLSR